MCFRHFVVVGLLKMGWKKLYLFNKKGSRTEAQVFCLLDFYVHETRQRHGYGIRLMEHMLKVFQSLLHILLYSIQLTLQCLNLI